MCDSRHNVVAPSGLTKSRVHIVRIYLSTENRWYIS